MMECVVPHWFVNAAFIISKRATTIKNTHHIITFLPKLLRNPNKPKSVFRLLCAKMLSFCHLSIRLLVTMEPHCALKT